MAYQISIHFYSGGHAVMQASDLVPAMTFAYNIQCTDGRIEYINVVNNMTGEVMFTTGG